MNWFEFYQDRFEAELESLRERGLQFTVDEQQKQNGVIRIDVKYPFDDRTINLVVIYPRTFPYLPPEVNAPDEQFPRHQHPNGGNLCLIGRRTIQWDNDQTIGQLLDDRLNVILDFAKSGDLKVLEGREEPQGEPISEYIHGGAHAGAYALYDSKMEIPSEIAAGRMVGLLRFSGGLPQIVINEVFDRHRNLLASGVVPALDGTHRVNLPWCRVNSLTGSLDQISSMYNAGEFDLPNMSALSKQNPFGFFALVYKEEVRLGEYADAISVFWRRWTPSKKGGRENVTIIRTFRAGPTDLAARMPAVRNLEAGSAVVFGLGALGAPVAVELARNGIGKLTFVDHDYVDPATVRRWVLGTTAFGASKAETLRSFLSREYPWTRYEVVDLKIGSADLSSEQDELSQIINAISSHDLVIDATAEMAVNHLLFDYCRVLKKPLVLGNLTPGAWGGIVYQWRPNTDDRCWMCLRSFLYPEWEGLPPADPAGELQPGGCPARTFTGASFDIQEIALEIVRTAAGLYGDAGYPETEWQLSVCTLREGDKRSATTWSTHEIPKRRGCAC